MYSVEFEENASKFLRKLEKSDVEAIVRKLYSIRGNPFRYLKRLQGAKLWRLRVGKFRVIVDVIVSGKRIIVLRIGLRKNIYNSF